VFRRFKVILDYSRRRMILEPRGDLNARIARRNETQAFAESDQPAERQV
jgi:hypothetical protein